MPYCPEQANKVLEFLDVAKEDRNMAGIFKFKDFYKIDIKEKKKITMNKIEEKE